MAKKERSVRHDRNIVAMSSAVSVATTRIAPTAVSPPFKTCSKCQSLFKIDGNISIHSTLAYSRCRCHRHFKFSLQQRQFGLSRGMWLDSQGTISAAGDNGMHQNEKSHGCKEHSEYVAAVHSSSDKETPHHSALPPITLFQKSVSGFSSSVLCEPSKSTKNVLHGNSPEVSTSKLPVLGCPSLVSHRIGQTSQSDVTRIHSTAMKKCSVFKQAAAQSLSVRQRIRELGDIIWYIPRSTQQALKTKFKSIDKNGDGHLTFSEFFRGLPQCSEGTISSSIQSTLKEMYLEVSDATYFGLREFVVCSVIAEVLLKYKVPIVVDRDYLKKILTPYIGCLSEFARSGMVSEKDIKDAARIFTDTQGYYRVSPLSTKVLEVFGKDSAPLLDCVALAPYYLSISRK